MDGFKTKDIGKAAFLLLCKTVTYEGKEEINGDLHFIFSPIQTAEDQAGLFEIRRAAPVQPKDYNDQLKTIKSWIWEWRKSRDGGSYGKYYR